jgi:hypothetical protein
MGFVSCDGISSTGDLLGTLLLTMFSIHALLSSVVLVVAILVSASPMAVQVEVVPDDGDYDPRRCKPHLYHVYLTVLMVGHPYYVLVTIGG